MEGGGDSSQKDDKIQIEPEIGTSKQTEAIENQSMDETKIVEKDDQTKTRATEISVPTPKTEEAKTERQQSDPAATDDAKLSEIEKTTPTGSGNNAMASGGHTSENDEALARAMSKSALGLEPDIAGLIWDWKDEDQTDNKELADRHKREGTRLLNAGKGYEAVEEYTMAISLDSENHVLYANRSLAHMKSGNHQASLFDAEQTLGLRPGWTKGYIRKGLALKALGRSNEAIEALEQGLRVDPNDEEIKTALRDCETEIEKRSASPPIDMKNLAGLTGITDQEMDLSTLLALQESLKGLSDNLSTSLGNEPKNDDAPTISMDKPKIDEPKINAADFMISDPKGKKNEWERYMNAPKISKSKPRNTDTGSKPSMTSQRDSYADTKKSSASRKNQQPERKSGITRPRRSKFLSSDSDSDTEIKPKAKPRKFSKAKSSDSDSDFRPKRTVAAAKQVDRGISDPRPKATEPEHKARSKPKKSFFALSDDDEPASAIKINPADFVISDPKKDFVEPEPKATDKKPKSKTSQAKPTATNRRSKVDDVESQRPKPKTRRSKQKSSDSEDDVRQKQASKSKTSEPKQEKAAPKAKVPEQKIDEFDPKSVSPEDFNRFMEAMNKMNMSEPKVEESKPKAKGRETDESKTEESETETADPKPELSSEPVFTDEEIATMRVVDKEKAKKAKLLGTDHSKRDDFENAHKYYDEAIKFDPTDISLYSNKALVYMKQNLPDKVREYSQKVILVAKKFGGDEKTVGKSYSRCAKTFLERTEYRIALEQFKKAMDLNPCNATTENIKLCKKKIRQQELSEAVEDEDGPYPQLKHDFLLEERSRCLAEELKFYEAISLFEDLDSVDEGDLGMKLLTAECYIQLGREGKAEKAIRSVERLLLKQPMCEIDDVISLAIDFTKNATPVRALLLLRIAADMLKQSDRRPDEIVAGLFRCISKMNEPVAAMLKKPEEKEQTKLEEMQEMHQQMIAHYSSTQKAIGMGEEKTYFEIEPPKKTQIMVKNRKKKTIIVDERSRVIAVDYGVEVMEEMLDELRTVDNADKENIAIKQAILCNMVNNNYSLTGQHEKAIRLLKNGVRGMKNVFGEFANQHRIYITMLVNIGAEYHNSEKFFEAERIEMRALEEVDYVLDYNGDDERQKEVSRIRESLRITRLHLKLA